MANVTGETNISRETRTQLRIERFGQTNHLKITDHNDLAGILELDEARWIATTAPTATVNADLVFLDRMDSDSDGRIRAEEVKDAVRFLLTHLTDQSGVVPNNTSLPISAINRDTELGRDMHTSATKILQRHQSTASAITLQEVRAVIAEVLAGGLDEAGIVLPEAATDDTIRRFIEDIIATVGGQPHPGGSLGVDQANLDAFLAEGRQYVGWLNQAGALAPDTVTETLPLGPDTADAYEAFSAVKVKLTQYFLLCDIKRVNPELLQRALSTPEGTLAINVIDVSEAETYLADAPLAAPNADGQISLCEAVNPYFRKPLEKFADRVVRPLLGEESTELDKEGLRKLSDQFEPYLKWRATKPSVKVDFLDTQTVQQYVNDTRFQEGLVELIQQSHRTAFVLDNIRELERLLLYQAYLLPFANSFVSCPQLYDPSHRALFEMGTLVMDGRHFNIAVKVLDRERHKEASADSNIFVLYVEIFGPNGEKAYEVAVPVTSGSRGNLRLNKWGIFNDANGEEWNARVVDILENPISVSEAMVEPFVRVVKSMMNRLEDFSNRAEQQLVSRKAGEKTKDSAPSGGLLAGGGIAVAALGSSFAFATKTLAAVSMKHIVIALFVLAAIITIPAGIATYFKLSRRDLSAILEGSGWGINARMRLTRAQADFFTHRPVE